MIKITKIRTKFLLGFFLSIWLITLTNLWAFYLINKINKAVDFASTQQRAVDDLTIHSSAIINTSLLFYHLTDPEKLPALESEFQGSLDHFHHSLEVLKENPALKGQWQEIENFHQELTVNLERLITSRKERLTEEKARPELIKDLRTNRHQIIEKTRAASARLKLDIAQMGYKDKEFIFQYQDQEHAREWQEAIETVIKGLKREGYGSLLIFAQSYSDLSQETIKTVNNINDLKLKEMYYLEKMRAANVESQINLTLLSNLIKKDFATTLKQSNWQKWLAFAAIFFSLLLGSLIVLILSRNITGSLGELVRVAKAVSTDHFDERAKIQSADELGYLASVFNQMLDYLEKSQRDLIALNQQLRASEQQLRASNQQLRASEQQLRASNQQLRAATQALVKERANLEIKVRARTRELSEAHGKLSSLIESLKLGVILTDPNLKVILANSEAKNILGKPRAKSLTLKNLKEKLKGVNLPQVLNSLLKNGQPFRTQEVTIGDKYYQLIIQPVQDREGKILLGTVIILEDISEEKQIAKMRSEIVSITSHQLRTPLSVIKGNLEMVLGEDFGKISREQKEILEEAFWGNERMIKLVNELMDVTKIEEGRVELEPKPTRLEELVAESVKELLPLAKEKKVSLTYKPPLTLLPKVNIDAQRIKQVLVNLIDNAIKYSSLNGQARVMVRIEKEKTKKFLKVIVKDNGLGIPREEQERIFEQFFRASNVSQIDPGGGTGLGLYIAKVTIERSGGKIWFKSEGEGKGATFYFTLPYK